MYMPHEAAYLCRTRSNFMGMLIKEYFISGSKNLFAIISIAQAIRNKEKAIDSVNYFGSI